MDSTSINCINCNTVFRPKSISNVFCCFECQQTYHSMMNDIKRYQRKDDIINEVMTGLWKRTNLSKLLKFYEIFGEGYKCDLCHITFEENISKYGVPLHIYSKPEIKNHDLMDEDNWFRFCTRCFAEIEFQKQLDI